MSLIGKELQSSRRAMSNVFSNRALRRIFIAFAGSLIGDGVFTLSAAVYAYRTGGATAVGALATARYIGIAAVAPLTSTLADQYNRKYVMIGCDLARLVLVVAAALCTATHASKWYVYALVVLVGMASTGFRPAQASILPLLSRHEDEIAGANVVSSTIDSIGLFAGPAFAGFLIAFTNITTAFAFDAATFVWSALFVLSARAPSPEERDPELVARYSGAAPAAAKAESFLVRAALGFRTILGDRDITVMLILYILQCVVAGASAVFSVAIALHLLHIGSSGLGLLESLLGIGGLVGGFIALMLVERSHLALDFGLGVMVWAAPLVLIAALPNLVSALAAMAIIGAANSLVDVNAITVLQHVVPNERLGRVLGAMEAGEIGGMALGALLMTMLIHAVGLRVGLTIIGGTVTLAVLPGLAAMRRIDARAFADGVVHHHSAAHHHLQLRHLRLRHTR